MSDSYMNCRLPLWLKIEYTLRHELHVTLSCLPLIWELKHYTLHRGYLQNLVFMFLLGGAVTSHYEWTVLAVLTVC